MGDDRRKNLVAGEGWEEIGKLHELFCKRVIGVPMTLSNGTCLKELGTNRKEKVLEGVKKYD
jgi:hypothetical protein